MNILKSGATGVLVSGWLAGLGGHTNAATIIASSCSQTDVQAAIDSAVSGDTVRVPAGTCTWGSAVSIPDTKGLTLDGGGATVSGALGLSQHATARSRLTGFNFTTVNAVSVGGSKGSAPFRIDHCTFASHLGGSTMLNVGGNGPGLIDHNRFNAPTNSEMIHNLGLGPGDASGWNDSITPGSADAVYIEDNTFTNNDPAFGTANPAYFWGNSSVQSYYGARTVFRHNLLLMSQIDQHGTAGMIGARWWEIYENTFSTDVPHASQCCFITLRAGSGVVFNNHHTGANLNGNSIDLYEEDTGYPALYQIGRGRDQAPEPAYVWGNDPFFSVGSQTPAMVQVDRDYYITPKPGYMPYTYPHPLSQTGGVSLATTAAAPVPVPAIIIRPNPFKARVEIGVRKAEPGDRSERIEINIFDSDGHLIYKPAPPSGIPAPGVVWDASGLPRGLYFVSVAGKSVAGHRVYVRCLPLIKR